MSDIISIMRKKVFEKGFQWVMGYNGAGFVLGFFCVEAVQSTNDEGRLEKNE